MKKVKINYNDTFGTMHSRDYYRGASFHFSGKWISGAHYVSDDYNIDFVVHGQTLLACAKSHLSSLDNEPTEFITDESGTIIGVISTYWDFVLSGIVGNSPGVKIIDNYWYICKNTGVPEEEQVWENTGVKAKMELSDLSPEEIALLQEPGKQVVTEFVNNTITQETGQNIDKIMSQKAVTDALSTKATVSQVTSAIANEVQRADLAYQPKGDYATNTTVNANKEDADNKFTAVNERIDTTNENVSNNADAIQEEIENRESEIERIEGLISAEETARVESDNALSNRISQEATARSTADNNLEQAIANINSKIPSEATAFNQLADKNFVHNEISTSSATFKGTYNTLAELEEQEADNNDYGFVVHTDALGNTIYSRYKYNGTEWLWEYDITSTEFSQSQWEAVNSGINSTLVTKLSDLPTNADLTTALNNKVDKVTGKQLSTEDYTTAEKTKLSGIAEGAQVNALEGVKVDGTELPITDKKVNVDLSGKVDVAAHESYEDQIFIYRQTGDDLPIIVKNANLDVIKGKSLVWNQIININAFPSSSAAGTTLTIVDGKVRINGTATQTYDYVSPGTVKDIFIAGHKYLLRHRGSADIKGAVGANREYPVFIPNADTFLTVNIVTERSLFIEVTNGVTYNNAEAYFNIFDLTLMFGSGNEPATVAEFESLFPEAYYDYNTGTIISNNANSIETVGFNQWDEEWEQGSIDDNGQPASYDNRIRSKNYIRVFALSTYCATMLSAEASSAFRIYYYNVNKEFISYEQIAVSSSINHATFTIPSGAYYIKIRTAGSVNYGPTYKNDICINLSDSDKNGTYEPYWKRKIELNLSTLKDVDGNLVFPYGGMHGVGTAFDSIKPEADGFIHYANRVFARVDLGTLDWSYTNGIFLTPSLVGVIAEPSNGIVPNAICPKYMPVDYPLSDRDKVFTVIFPASSAHGQIWLKDSAYTDATTFKAAMDSVYLYYEVATPAVVELATPIRVDYKVDWLGTERVISDTVPTPLFRADITYHEANIKDIEIEGITEYLKREELTDELDKLDTIEEGAQENKIEHIQINGTEQTITSKTVNLPAYPTTLPASDVSAWAKAATKPSYNFSEIGGTVADSQLPDTISSDITGTAMGLKTEKLTDQEFVYRATPNTIKAKSLTLDKIKGRTLAWNQLVHNGNFVDGTGWNPEDCTATFTNNEATITNTGINGASCKRTNINFIASHKYYIGCDAKSGDLTSNLIMLYDGTNSVYLSLTSIASSYKRYGFIRTIDASTTGGHIQLFRTLNNTTVGTVVYKNVEIFDLTLMFGAGNEPSTVEEFEAMFPEAYYPYNAGMLISNDASEIETVGRNLWDEEWLAGYYRQDGTYVSADNRICSKNWVPIFPSTKYFSKSPVALTFFFYDAGKNFIEGSAVSISSNTEFTTPANARWCLWYCTNSDYGNVYNHDICINLSDESFNGQYEPYRKSTLHLGLNNIRVKSHNIWDEEWEHKTISTTDGETRTVDNTITSSKNKVGVFAGKKYYFKNGHNANPFRVFLYDASASFISSEVVSGNSEYTIPAGVAYICFQCTYADSYANDICINVSSSFNGQYEPHGVLIINGVKSAPGSITMTGGVLGGAYDEISNKFIKRIERLVFDGTENWGKASGIFRLVGWYDGHPLPYYHTYIANVDQGGVGMCSVFGQSYLTNGAVNGNYSLLVGDVNWGFDILSSVVPGGSDTTVEQFKAWLASLYAAGTPMTLDYALATPIEYELVEPLVPTVKAGTTEARISPNIDGLSAPFRADITYSASENNDAATSQYAATAGRLLNAQTIWGQSFDGSDSVSGALSGVTTLNASGAITAGSFVKSGGTASQFLKADGSVDNTAYYHPGNSNLNTVDWKAKNLTASGELSGNAFKVIAEHIAKLTSRVEALENGIGVTDTLSSNSIDSANGYYVNGDKTVIIGSGAPTVVPAFAGQFYINTSGPALYYAVNNSATTDWKQA